MIQNLISKSEVKKTPPHVESFPGARFSDRVRGRVADLVTAGKLQQVRNSRSDVVEITDESLANYKRSVGIGWPENPNLSFLGIVYAAPKKTVET